MENDNVYTKYCLVPQCLSSTKVSPGKICLSLPVGSSDKIKEKRKLWLRAINRNDSSEKTRGFVCEDHFEVQLEEDMENYMRCKLIGGNIYLKQHAKRSPV